MYSLQIPLTSEINSTLYLHPIGKAHPLLQSYYGPGNGSIGVFSASCDPTLESLSDCILDLLPHGNRQCTRYTEAGVRCECE